MGLPVLARVYLSPQKNFRIPTTPGRDVVFFGGRAEIRDSRDMWTILQRKDATVEVPASSMDLLPGWLNQLDELHRPMATLVMPDGYALGYEDKFFLAQQPEFRNEQGRTTEEEEAYQAELAAAS